MTRINATAQISPERPCQAAMTVNMPEEDTQRSRPLPPTTLLREVETPARPLANGRTRACATSALHCIQDRMPPQTRKVRTNPASSAAVGRRGFLVRREQYARLFDTIRRTDG